MLSFGEDCMLDGNALVKFLRERGFSTLCHVNTAATALTFLKNGGLLSRKYVEEHPTTCFQTSQDSDRLDRNFGIFNDIFFDAEDIWNHCGMKYCYYGPITFYYDVKILSKFSNIYVSKENPVHWNSGCLSDNCFVGIDELKCSILNSSYSWPIANHIMLHNQEILNFGNDLKKILLWCPDVNIAGYYKENIIKVYNIFDELCRSMNIQFGCRQMMNSKWSQVVDDRKVYKFYDVNI